MVEPMSVSLAVSIVIPTRNRGALIGDTLRALLNLTEPGVEILVIDQSTDQQTLRAVRSIAADDQRVRHFPTATVGSSAARNLGALHARGTIVAFVDDDCVISDAWLPAIAAEFLDRRVTGLYCRLQAYQQSGRRPTDAALKHAPNREEYQGKVPPWHIGHGPSMAFRRADFLAVGGFDPLLGAGGKLQSNEDGDLAYRLLARGGCIVYCANALAFHKQWKSWPARLRMERAYGIGAGAQFAKYLRCGDAYGWQLLRTWIWELGVRRLGAGLIKWRSLRVMQLASCQLIYPWVGILSSWRYPVDRAQMTYIDVAEHPGTSALAHS